MLAIILGNILWTRNSVQLENDHGHLYLSPKEEEMREKADRINQHQEEWEQTLDKAY